MECPKCQAEWTPGNASSQLVNCPFCGIALAIATPADENCTMQTVMAQIVKRFGEGILSQERN